MRKRYPGLFKSRVGNKFIYTHLGTIDLIGGYHERIGNSLTLVCDGVRIPLPADIENLIFLNISSWAGGARNLWYTEEELRERAKLGQNLSLKKQSFSDHLIEVIGVTSLIHLGQCQIGVNTPIKICQGSVIELKVAPEPGANKKKRHAM
jgi:diacylglycerol kinase (ATP)